MSDSFEPMDPNSALLLLGKYSRWQIRVYVLFSLAFGWIFAWIYMPIIFIGDTPAHRCYVPHLDDPPPTHTNLTTQPPLHPHTTTHADTHDSTWLHPQLNESVPYEMREGELVPSQCQQYVNFSYLTNDTERCTSGYMYDPYSGYISTIVTDWDLVCGKNILVELSMTIHGVGSVLGNIFYPTLADRLGRRPIFLFCLWGMSVFNTVKAFSPNYLCFAILAFLSGCQEQGMMSVSIVMALELFPTEQRTFAGNGIEFAWVGGLITLTPLAYFFRDWRHLVLVAGTPTLLSFTLYWLVPESIPWLVANGREAEAEKILRTAAKTNNVTLPESVFVDNSGDKETADSRKSDNVNSNGDVVLIGQPAQSSHESVVFVAPMHGAFGSQDCIEPLPKQRRKNKTPGFWENLKRRSSKNSSDKSTTNSHGYAPVKSGDSEVNKTSEQSKHDVVNSCVSVTSEKYEATLIDLVRSIVLRRYTVALAVLWFANNLVYISLTLTMTSLAGDRYLNFFLYALVEVPAYVICWVAMEKLGRVRPLVAFHVICGISLMLTVLQLTNIGSQLTPLLVTLSMIGKFAISASWATIYVLSPEVLPTNIRNTGIGVGQFAARSASFLGPYTRLLARSVYWLPPVLLGAVSIIAGLTALLLPETRWRPLPETVEQVELWDKQRSFKRQEFRETEYQNGKTAEIAE